MSHPNFSIVKAKSHDEISIAVKYCRKMEAWKLALQDDEIFFALTPHRCYFGMLGDEKICYVQVISYGEKEEYCYGGMLVVKKEYRQQGFGKQIFEKAWADIPESSLVGLSAVVPVDLEYMKYGFKTSWNEHWYLFDANKIVETLDSSVEDVAIVRYEDVNFQSLVDYDTNAFCYSREVYLKMVGEVSNSEGWVATNRDNTIVGYVVARCALDMSEWLLFPLIANNLSVAKSLLIVLSKFLIGQPVKSFAMVVPDINSSAVKFAEQFGEQKTSETRRMFAKGNPPDKMVENHATMIFSSNPNIG